MHFLALLAIFKNEASTLEEWISHYIWQGVEHIYLINNNSDDNYMDILKPYIDSGYISLYNLFEHAQQVKHYNTVFNEVKNEMEWLMVCDIDEYWFGTENTIKEYLINIPIEVNSIRTYWTIFGSSGLIDQPKEIRKSFLNCSYHEPSDKRHCVSKYIARVRDIRSLHVHEALFNTKENEIEENVKLMNFHYRIMSRNYFEFNIMLKGDGVGGKKTWDYFNFYDNNTSIDLTLSNLVKSGYKNQL